MLLSISVLIPILAVYLMLSKAKCPNFLLKLSLSVGLAAGLTSCTFFIIGLNIFGSPNIAYQISEMAIFAGIAMIFAVMIRKEPVSMPENTDMLTERKLYAAAFLPALGISLISSISAFVVKHLYLPHGAWDAWTIWNMRARFIFRLGEQWKEIYAHYTHYPHTDYPLLLSGTIARAWTYFGQESVRIPAAIALLFSLTTIALIYSSISHFKGRLHGAMAALMLIAAPYFIVQSVWQYADVPLGCMVLSTLIFFALEDSSSTDDTHRFAIFAGMSTGFCAWMKNEGLLIMLCMILSRAIIVIPAKGFKAYISEIKWFMMGFLPILLMIAFYKIRLAPPNDLVSGQGAATLQRLTDISRYRITLKYYMVLAVKMLRWEILLFPAAIFLLGFSRKKRCNLSIRTAWIAIILILIGYFMVYITTPKNIVLHIETSYKRLLLHVFPGIVFAFFMMLASSEETRSRFAETIAEHDKV